MKFTLMRFNPRRAMRGAEAAEILCEEDEYADLLWMSERDIKRNIDEFGAHPELSKALDHYKTRTEFPARAS